MTERSKKLLRQYKRNLGAENAEAFFLSAADKIAAQEPDAQEVNFLRNFPAFAAIVDTSYAEYEDRLKIAGRNIEISSKELTTAYRNVENLNLSINAMLDSLGQGLLFFDNKGICSPVFSKSCIELLEKDPANKPLPAVLDFTAEKETQFYSWLAIVFGGHSALDFCDLKALLPSEIVNRQGRIIELDYRPMYGGDGDLASVLLITTDVTHIRQAQNKLQQIQSEAQKVQQVARNRNIFHSFIWNLYSFMDMAEMMLNEPLSAENRAMMMRELHTYKGQASSFILQDLSEMIHALEMDLRQNATTANNVLKLSFTKIREALEQEKDFARGLFGSDFMAQGKVRTVEVGKINALMDVIAYHLKDEDARADIYRTIKRDFLSTPVFHAFLSFEREIGRLAEQQGRPIPICEITGDNVPIVVSEYDKFFNGLIHFARNIIDHGIESPQERIAAGKPSEGLVRIIVEKDAAGPDTLRIRISDDGRGIDPDLIRQKLAEERHIDTSAESDEEVIQHIFDPEFSLRKEVSLLSGQGVGMNALQDVVQKMGGTIAVRSDWTNRRGTEIIFCLPHSL